MSQNIVTIIYCYLYVIRDRFASTEFYKRKKKLAFESFKRKITTAENLYFLSNKYYKIIMSNIFKLLIKRISHSLHTFI